MIYRFTMMVVIVLFLMSELETYTYKVLLIYISGKEMVAKYLHTLQMMVLVN